LLLRRLCCGFPLPQDHDDLLFVKRDAVIGRFLISDGLYSKLEEFYGLMLRTETASH